MESVANFPPEAGLKGCVRVASGDIRLNNYDERGNQMIRYKFWGIVLLQVLFLIFIVVRYHYALATGVPVFLQAVPVDPRDLFRGDYVTLSYEISNIRLDTIENRAGSMNYGNTVYVGLERGEKYWRATTLDKAFHPTTHSAVWLKAQVMSSFEGRVRLRYGIEQFFIPEGTGHLIEQERNRERVSVQIRVTDSGTALVKQLYVNDQPVTYQPIR